MKRWLKWVFPWFYLPKIEAELEINRMQVVACGVAALANTRESAKQQRIPRDNPYWSASYSDVCNAVNREMVLREGFERECADIDAVIKHLGWNPEDFRTEGGNLEVWKLKDALSAVTRPGAGG